MQQLWGLKLGIAISQDVLAVADLGGTPPSGQIFLDFMQFSGTFN